MYHSRQKRKATLSCVALRTSGTGVPASDMAVRGRSAVAGGGPWRRGGGGEAVVIVVVVVVVVGARMGGGQIEESCPPGKSS